MKKISTKGFTLIELLVVVAIIAILMSFTFPVFGKAKSNAHRLECAANLKQIVTAWLTYAADHDDYASPSYKYYSGKWPKQKHWDTFIHQDKSIDQKKGFLRPYLKVHSDSKEVKPALCCPDYHPYIIKDKKALEDRKENDYTTGYGYNSTYIGGGSSELPGKTPYEPIPRESCTLASIKQPSKTIVFADTLWWETYGESKGYRGGRQIRDPKEKELTQQKKRSWNLYPNATVHFRHNGFANVAYADGHVKAVKNREYKRPTLEGISKDLGAIHPKDGKYDIKQNNAF